MPFQTASLRGFKCHAVVPRGVLCLRAHAHTGAQRGWKWRVCHLADAEGTAATGGSGAVLFRLGGSEQC